METSDSQVAPRFAVQPEKGDKPPRNSRRPLLGIMFSNHAKKGKEEYSRIEDGGESSLQLPQRTRLGSVQRHVFTAKTAIILVVILVSSGLAWIWASTHLRNGRWHPQTMIPRIGIAPVHFHFSDLYMEYTDESNKAWDELVPVQYGLIEIEDPMRYDLKPGHVDAENPNKAWYGISIFHQLHCLTAIRDTLRAVKTDQPARAWGGPDHLEHCLDYLRQGLMCAADTTIEWPLFVNHGFKDDGPITGEGIAHQCRDWDTVLKFGRNNGALKSTDERNVSDIIHGA